MSTIPDFDAGEVILIDKPETWSSFAVVKKLRGGLKVKKIGHAGTLDPLATGLLILCTGKKTKTIDTYQGQEKEYEATIVLGGTTPSFDLETAVENVQVVDHLTEKDIQLAVNKFVGTIDQKPPVFSAIKKNGKKLYEYARAGENIEIKTRSITIRKITIEAIDLPLLKVKVNCSKGTYIRSLAHDIGQALGVGAYLGKLRRTKIGDFHVKDAVGGPIEYLNYIDHLKQEQDESL